MWLLFADLNIEPAFYTGHFNVDKATDTFLSFKGWNKGVAFVNDFNVGRFWPVENGFVIIITFFLQI